MNEHRCEALTTTGRRCRRNAIAYVTVANRELLLCNEHQRAASEGRLRVVKRQIAIA